MSGAVKIVQMNSQVGRIDENLAEIISQITSAPAGSLVVFPEHALTGWPLGDLAFSEELIEKSIAASVTLDRFMQANADFRRTVVVGVLGYDGISSILVTGAALIQSVDTGIIKISFEDKTFGIVFGDELDQHVADGTLRASNLANLIVLGSPTYSGQMLREYDAVLKAAIRSANVDSVIAVNLAGAQDGIIFTGGSQVALRKSGVTARLKNFEEDSILIEDVQLRHSQELNEGDEDREENLYNAAVVGLRDYVQKNGMKTVLIGVSGGIDSSLTASIAADAVGGENVYGVSMPSKYSSDGSKTDAEQLMKNIGGHFRTVPIAEAFDVFKNTLGLTGLAEENLQARLRAVILMGISNQENHLVLAPGNKSEAAMGYSTMYGDTVGGYAVIGDLYKRDVYALAEWRNGQANAPIPENSITKAPSAELRPGQKDQDSLPDYDLLDAFLFDHLENGMERKTLEFKYGVELTTDLLKKLDLGEWKRRQEPMGSKLSTVTFGRDRDMPITR